MRVHRSIRLAVVDIRKGVHCMVPKSLFAGEL